MDAVMSKRFQVKFEESLRNDIYDSVMRQNTCRFHGMDSTKLMTYVRTNATVIANNFCGTTLTILAVGIMGIVTLGIMGSYSPVLMMISLLCAAISAIPPIVCNKKLDKCLKSKLDKDREMTFQLRESLEGKETIEAFGVFSTFRMRFQKVCQDYADCDYKWQVMLSLLQNMSNVLQKFVWFLAFMVAGLMTIRGSITLGTMMMFITLFVEFNSCIALLAQVTPLLFGTLSTAKEMIEMMDDKQVSFSGQKTPSLNRSLDVKDISFQYVKDVPVIRHLNLTIGKNEKVVLIGPSGCGKSTLIKLLSGYFPGYSGTISYDDQELRELDVEKLRGLVTVIQQNTFIFNDTIRFNICMGENFPEKQLQQVLALSGVDRFVKDIPDGLEGKCGERGSRLSGGQRQRIAIARALIRGVKMLILDESVSAIDVKTANEIEQELLDNPNLTLLTITHRIKDGLIDQYDRIVLMEDGKLKETE